MSERPLPQYLLDLIAAGAPEEKGIHKWMFRMSAALHAYRSNEQIAEILKTLLIDGRRGVGEREMAAAIVDSMPGEHAESEETSHYCAWPQADEDEIRDAIGGHTMADLVKVSPVKDDLGTEKYIDILFPGDPLLCVAAQMNRSATRRREAWRGNLERLPLIVPTPMTVREGLTKDGRKTERSLLNTDPNRRYLVIEFDGRGFDDQAAILLYLANEVAPLTLAVHSGNTSLHGWFYCLGVPEQRLEGLMRRACVLGADSATWCRCQLVRMPGGTRETGEKQEVYFFNPETINED